MQKMAYQLSFSRDFGKKRNTEVYRPRDTLQFNLLMRNLNRRLSFYEHKAQKPCQCSTSNIAKTCRSQVCSILLNYSMLISLGDIDIVANRSPKSIARHTPPLMGAGGTGALAAAPSNDK